MNTPVKVKRARQSHSNTPVSGDRGRHKCVINGVYNPPAQKLQKNYEHEFNKFMRSVKAVFDYMDNRCDDIMDCFRFDDVRDVTLIIKSHELPPELLSFVTQQLMEWRELFRNVQWLKRYSILSHDVRHLNQRRFDLEERLKTLNEIEMEFEAFDLNIEHVKDWYDNPEELSDCIVKMIKDRRQEESAVDPLQNIPMLSKRKSVRKWRRKHYECSSDESDESVSSEGGNSSIFGNGADSTLADLSDAADNENDFAAFFND